MILFTCKCGKSFKVKKEWVGRSGRCSGCGQKVLIQAPADDQTAVVEYVTMNCDCGHGFRVRKDAGSQKMKCQKCGHEAIYNPLQDDTAETDVTLGADVKTISVKCICGQVNVVRHDMLRDARCQSCRRTLDDGL